jgi:VIT1/CCC1 family predicted Fe2+/Mn2+ transporter
MVGLFPTSQLLTEEAIYEQFMEEEDARLAAELEQTANAAAEAEEKFERQMREKIKQKIADDKSQRQREKAHREARSSRLSTKPPNHACLVPPVVPT